MRQETTNRSVVAPVFGGALRGLAVGATAFLDAGYREERGDYDAVREHHRAMGCVCYENHDMGLYFINDPDDYWIEILPLK